MLAIIELVSGASTGRALEAKLGESIEVGRASLAGLGLPQDAHMSARHFAIACIDGQCNIRDLGSTNGTFVNGTKISEARLKDGDRIEAGTSIFVLRLHYDNLAKLASEESAVSSTAPSVTLTERSLAPIPLLQFTNETPFPVTTLRWSGVDSKPRLTIVVKATFVMGGDGIDVRLTPKQLPLFNADILTDTEPPSVRFESDRVPFKACADVVLVGRAHAPEGKPVTQLVAGVRVGQLRSGVVVFGDRTWESQFLDAPTISQPPKPFFAMDLVYERAFGGFDGPAGMYCKENLVGTGYIGASKDSGYQILRTPKIRLIPGRAVPSPSGSGSTAVGGRLGSRMRARTTRST